MLWRAGVLKIPAVNQPSRSRRKSTERAGGKKQRCLNPKQNCESLAERKRRENHWRASPIKTGNTGAAGAKS